MTTHDEQEFAGALEQVLSDASHWDGSPEAMFDKVRRQLQPRPWYFRYRPQAAVLAAALSLVLAIGVYQYMGISAVPVIPADTPVIKKPIVEAADLPLIGSMEKLQELTGIGSQDEKNLFVDGTRTVFELSSANMRKSVTVTGGDDAGYSTTNIQVQGVDEADIVKSDGRYLYQARGAEVTISQIYPDSEMRVAGRIALGESVFAQELFLDGQYLTVLTSQWMNNRLENKLQRMWIPQTSSRILVYDIANREVPLKVRDVEVDGSVLSSRKVGSVLYLVAQKPLYQYFSDDEPVIFFRDSAGGQETKEIGLDNIRYFPGVGYEAFLTVLALDVTDGRREANVDVYLGSGRNIFMSQQNLYIALEQWDFDGVSESDAKTLVHKFSVADTDVVYRGMGEVPGSILNQFSMDEYDGYFRIATTSREGRMSSNVYILDQSMTITGRLEGLAPDEQIYSVRFMGEKGYLVTFELIDPLFVIDLQDPASPRVLGELKIPGFSNYLHPLDETTLLGIGRDTDVVYRGNSPVVQQKGIKLAIFDVADVGNPKELYVEIIGDEASYSEALWDHKAVLFHNGYLAIPYHYFGTNEYQGALVYRVDKNSGFTPLGRVSHYDEGRPDYRQEYNGHIVRSLIIENTFYTVSYAFVRASRLATGLPDLAALPLN